MTDEYWKKPDPQEDQQPKTANVGLWSRSRAFRVVAWIVVVLAVVALALVVSAYLSGFSSVFEMIEWIRQSANL
jgi:anti-sigma-K factor RskA